MVKTNSHKKREGGRDDDGGYAAPLPVLAAGLEARYQGGGIVVWDGGGVAALDSAPAVPPGPQ